MVLFILFISLCLSFLFFSLLLLLLLAAGLYFHFVKTCFDDFSTLGSFHQEREIMLSLWNKIQEILNFSFQPFNSQDLIVNSPLKLLHISL